MFNRKSTLVLAITVGLGIAAMVPANARPGISTPSITHSPVVSNPLNSRGGTQNPNMPQSGGGNPGWWNPPPGQFGSTPTNVPQTPAGPCNGHC